MGSRRGRRGSGPSGMVGGEDRVGALEGGGRGAMQREAARGGGGESRCSEVADKGGYRVHVFEAARARSFLLQEIGRYRVLSIVRRLWLWR